MLKTDYLKTDYESFGPIIKVDMTGMGVFEMPVVGKGGAKTKKIEQVKLAARCSVGDQVVRKAGTVRPFFVIAKAEWANMPATEEEAAEQAAKADPSTAALLARIAALEAKQTPSAKEE